MLCENSIGDMRVIDFCSRFAGQINLLQAGSTNGNALSQQRRTPRLFSRCLGIHDSFVGQEIRILGFDLPHVLSGGLAPWRDSTRISGYEMDSIKIFVLYSSLCHTRVESLATRRFGRSRISPRAG